jgi:hypothetical protein
MGKLIRFLLVALLVTSCSIHSNSRATSSDISESLSSRNVSKALADCKPLWTNPNLDVNGPLLNWNLAHSGNGFDFLTHGQQLQLGGWISPIGGRVELLQTLLAWRALEKANGRAPHSGAEYISWLFAKNPDLQRFPTMAPKSLPGLYYVMVNPQTGKLYSSFDGSVKEPGAVIFHKLTSNEDAKRAFASRPGADLFAQPQYNEGYEIVVYGENPDKVLDTAVVLTDKRKAPNQAKDSDCPTCP